MKRRIRVSATGKLKILEARNKKGWKISQDDPRSLQAASLYIIREYAKINQIKECDRETALRDRISWSRHLETIFKFKKDNNRRKIEQTKIELIESTASCIETIEKLIYEEEIYPAGISYGTWTRFCSQTKQEAIGETAFKAYCHVLGLNWQEIGEPVIRVDKKPETQQILSFQPVVYQNLVAPNCIKFVGRERQLKLLLQYLASDCIYRISVEGIGGVGKTTLILEAAHRCLQRKEFEAIIFTSAQQQRLRVRQILPCLQQQRTLEDVFAAIADTLKKPQILQGNFANRLKNVVNTLQQIPTLLIFDNLETYEDIENILAFIYELPPTVKVITTSREKILLEDFQTIAIAPLPESEALKLIEHHLNREEPTPPFEGGACALRQQLILELSQLQILYQNTGGVPAAIVYAIGQLTAGYSLETILPSMTLNDADFARFYFERAIVSIAEKPAYQLLMTIAIFPQGATIEAIVFVSNLSNTMAIEKLAHLQQLNLINLQQQRYQMLPLTREYALIKLKNEPELSQTLGYRWVNYYQNYLEQNIEVVENGWNNYQSLDREWINIREVVDWCIENNLDRHFLQLWRFLRNYTHIYGHWQERLAWMDWLEMTARKDRDWKNLIQALLDKGKTLILLDLPQRRQEAIDLLSFAWELSRKHLKIAHEIGINIAIIYIQKEKFELAHSWLKRVERSLTIDLPSDRHNILIAKIFYYQAEIFNRQKKYQQAKQYYQQALKHAQLSNWKSGIVYNQLSIAIVDIEQQQNLAQAQQSLETNMKIVENYQDRRCFAFCKRAFALLEKAKGNQQKFIQWTALAKEDFEYLGMTQQLIEMQTSSEK